MTDARGVILVTGASRGLGRALCQTYLQRGWRVLPLVRESTAASNFGHAGAARCHPVVADLRHDGAGASIRSQVADVTARLDVLVNNAGIPGHAHLLHEVDTAEVRELLEVHCVGALRCTQALLPLLQRSAEPRVVNISSRVGSFAYGAARLSLADEISYSYRIAKAAQNMLTLSMSHELQAHGILVWAVHPGEFRSGLNPEGEESAAVAARRLADWVDRAGKEEQGRMHDTRNGGMAW